MDESYAQPHERPNEPHQPHQPQAFDLETYRAELERIQKIDFALVELNLYLDTHPTDMQAIQQFNQLAQNRRTMAYAFESKFGPLMGFGHSFSRFPWQWVQTPWPWQV